LLAQDNFFTVERLVPASVPHVTFTLGFGGREPSGFRWLLATAGELEIDAPCTVCHGDLLLRVASFARTRTIAFASVSGQPLGHASIPSHPVELRLALRFRKRVLIRVTATPGPESIAAATGSTDRPSVAVAFGDETYIAGRH
jgi:hypothetical protein